HGAPHVRRHRSGRQAVACPSSRARQRRDPGVPSGRRSPPRGPPLRPQELTHEAVARGAPPEPSFSAVPHRGTGDRAMSLTAGSGRAASSPTPSESPSMGPLSGTSVSISKLAEHLGETVAVRGWLYNKRSSGKLH